MGITSLDIKNNLYVNHDKIINIQDFNSEKLSVIKNNNNKIHVYYDHNPIFFTINGLKCYFEEHGDESNIILGPKKTKYLTIIFTSKLIKILIEIMLRLNLNQTKMYL